MLRSTDHRRIVLCGWLLVALLAVPVQAQDMGLRFSTYWGGAGEDQVRSVTSDFEGNVYVVGGTESNTLPITLGDPYQGGRDAWLAKFDPQGALLWCRYFGGPNFEQAYGVRVDGMGNVVICGRGSLGTVPADPAVHGFQATFEPALANAGTDGYTNGFVAKFDRYGGLLWASYFAAAGAPNDYGLIVRGLDVDAAGDVYLASNWNGGVYPPPIAGAFRNGPAGGPDPDQKDGVVAKVSADGRQVLWARYVGGSGTESLGISVRVDATGNVYYANSTDSEDFPVTPGAFDTSLSGIRDFFVQKMDADGDVLWATYLGGSGGELGETNVLAIDAQGNPIVALVTFSLDYPTTPGAVGTVDGGGGRPDIAVTKLASDGTRLLASTYLAGAGADHVEGIEVDADGNVTIAGATNSLDLGARGLLPGAFQAGFAGVVDGLVIQLAPDFASVRYGSLFGGSGEDQARALALGPQGAVILAGITKSIDLPVTGGALQPQYTGAVGLYDAYVACLAPMPRAAEIFSVFGEVAHPSTPGWEALEVRAIPGWGATWRRVEDPAIAPEGIAYGQLVGDQAWHRVDFDWGTAQDLSGFTSLKLRFKGSALIDQNGLKVQLGDRTAHWSTPEYPQTVRVIPGPAGYWTEVTIPLSATTPNLASARTLRIQANLRYNQTGQGNYVGPFSFELDDVRFER